MFKAEAAATIPTLCGMMTPETPRRCSRSYPGAPDQVRLVRAFLRDVLAGVPRADDAVTVMSELATNAILYSQSSTPGGQFTAWVEVTDGSYIWVAVQDRGGPWEAHRSIVLSGHGLDLVQGIAGDGRWGITGDEHGRLIWARIPWSGAQPPAGQPVTWEVTMPVQERSDDPSIQAELQKLATGVTGRGLTAALRTPAGKLPYLDVCNPHVMVMTERVYAQAGSFWYGWDERIGRYDELEQVAALITRVLGMDATESVPTPHGETPG
jgi:serine/threonine-protein kinase RsbW